MNPCALALLLTASHQWVEISHDKSEVTVRLRVGDEFHLVATDMIDSVHVPGDHDDKVIRRVGCIGERRYRAVGVGTSTVRGWWGRERPEREFRVTVVVEAKE